MGKVGGWDRRGAWTVSWVSSERSLYVPVDWRTARKSGSGKLVWNREDSVDMAGDIQVYDGME